MKQRYVGEARHAILTAVPGTQRPKTVVVVDPDINVRNPDQVEWAIDDALIQKLFSGRYGQRSGVVDWGGLFGALFARILR